MGTLCFVRGAADRFGVKATFRSAFLAALPSRAPAAAAAGIRAKSSARDSAHGAVERFVCHPLPHRALLKIQGQDTSSFLQGLITNDMRLLEEPERAALYSHMLNVQGRTLFDILLYRLKDAEGGQTLLLECDSTVEDSALRHLKVYKIRRKVSVSSCPELSVWAVLSQQSRTDPDPSKPKLSAPDKALVWEADPRAVHMGWRLVLHRSVDPTDIVASCQKGDAEDYHRHRYAIGLPEGVKDLPPGVALPLESNLVYMQGISFSKGCYIGQELTARTHHTGVVRKRLMPFRSSSPLQQVAEGTAVETQSGKPAGKHRSGIGELGLGLIRTAHAKEVLTLRCADDSTVTLEASVPDWWPKDVRTM